MFHQLQPVQPHFSGTLAKPYPGRSTRRRSGASSKKLISCVRPGVRLTRARPVRCVMAFIAVDLPEFERPQRQISRPLSGAS